MWGAELCQSNCPSGCHQRGAEPAGKQHHPKTALTSHHPLLRRGNPVPLGRGAGGKERAGEARGAGRLCAVAASASPCVTEEQNTPGAGAAVSS